MESTDLSRAKPFLYSWVTFQQNKVKGKKKKKTHMVAIHWDRKGGSECHFGERQNDICVGKQGASVLEFRLDLGLGQGQNTRLSTIVIGQPPNRQRPHSSSGKLLRIFPSLCSISHLVLSSSDHREGFFTSVSWQNTLCSLQGTGSQAGAKGAAVLPRWVF